MFTRHGSRNLNIWAPLASLALVALFATPALRASFAGLVGGSAALFVLVTVLSLISGSREGLTTFFAASFSEPIRAKVRSKGLPRIRSHGRGSDLRLVAWPR
jgi:hypothetical protein